MSNDGMIIRAGATRAAGASAVAGATLMLGAGAGVAGGATISVGEGGGAAMVGGLDNGPVGWVVEMEAGGAEAASAPQAVVAARATTAVIPRAMRRRGAIMVINR